MALAALSRKNALIVEPIRRTWRKSSSYSSGRNLTVTLTVRPALSSVSVIRTLRTFRISTGRPKSPRRRVSGRRDRKARRGVAATGTTSPRSSASSRPDHEDIGTIHRTLRKPTALQRVDASAPVNPDSCRQRRRRALLRPADDALQPRSRDPWERTASRRWWTVIGWQRNSRRRGQILVHNKVRGAPGGNARGRGFRAWWAKPGREFTPCACGWRPDLGQHYRVQRTGPVVGRR
jgi:hypothetical protein